MVALQETSSLPDFAYELFDAVGYKDAEDIISTSVAELKQELSLANEKLKITEEPLSEEHLSRWVENLRDEIPSLASDEPAEIPKSRKAKSDYKIVFFDDENEVTRSLEKAPHAIRVPSSKLEQDITSIDSLSMRVAIFFTDGSLAVKINDHSSYGQNDDAAPLKKLTPQTHTEKKPVTPDNFKAPEEQDIQPLKRRSVRSVVTPSKDLNKGIDPGSRKFAKGVLHPHPTRIRLGAIFTLITILLTVLCLGTLAGVVYNHKELGEQFDWWLGGTFFAGIITLILYLRFGVKARCCVCSQRLNVSKKCKKHIKAHHIRFIGYIIPTACQLLLYRWFYCMFCGTAIRLKK